jgi:predicted nucleic acid-binding Zn ribbon protein
MLFHGGDVCAKLRVLSHKRFEEAGVQQRMEEIGKVLPLIFSRQVGKGGPRMAEVLASLWPRVAGKPVAEHSRPVGFGGGTLTIESDGLCWATQLRALSAEIQREINGFLGAPVVKQVKVRCVLAPGERRKTAASNWKMV